MPADSGKNRGTVLWGRKPGGGAKKAAPVKSANSRARGTVLCRGGPAPRAAKYIVPSKVAHSAEDEGVQTTTGVSGGTASGDDGDNKVNTQIDESAIELASTRAPPATQAKTVANQPCTSTTAASPPSPSSTARVGEADTLEGPSLTAEQQETELSQRGLAWKRASMWAPKQDAREDRPEEEDQQEIETQGNNDQAQQPPKGCFSWLFPQPPPPATELPAPTIRFDDSMR